MSDDDKTVMRQPLADDRTVMRPRPGGNRGATPPPSAPPPTAPTAPPPPQTGAAPVPLPLSTAGINPLVAAASTLLALINQLRGTAQQGDVNLLRTQIMHAIRAFERDAQGAGVSREMTLTGRYILCAALDETVLGTPWGSNSFWSSHSLLSTFHNETWGGEKVFILLERFSQAPAAHLDMLELIYLCLSLGFRGKYMIMQGGAEHLETVRLRLYEQIRAQRPAFERELSPHWQPQASARGGLRRYLPLWVVAACAGAVLVLVYIGLTFWLGTLASPLEHELQRIGTEYAAVSTAPPPTQDVAGAGAGAHE